MKLKPLPNTVVHVPTRESKDELIEMYHDAGWNWNNGAPTLCLPVVCDFIEAKDSFFQVSKKSQLFGYRIITLEQFKQEQGLMKKELKDMHDTTEVDLSTRKIVDDLRSAAILGVGVTYEVLDDYIRTKAMQIAKAMKLLTSEIEKAKVEARLDELNNVCVECSFIHLDVDGETLSVTREERLQQLSEELSNLQEEQK